MQLKIYSFLPNEILKKIIENKNDFIIEPFLDPEWIKIWWKNIGINEYSEIKFFVFNKDDEPVLVIPLVSRKFFYLKIIEVAGGKVSDYLSPIFYKKYFFTKKDLKFINDEIFKYFLNHDLIFFKKQKQYSSFVNPLLNMDTPILGLHKSYSINLLNFNKDKRIRKILSDNRRQKKRLFSFGEVKFVNTDISEERVNILKNMIKQKEERYKQTNVWNMFNLKYYKDFYYDLLKSEFNFLKLHITGIKVNNNYISTHLGFFNDKVFYYLMPSFDNKKFGSYSGGNILLENLIEYTQSKNIETFDFTIGNENYKKKWTNESNELFDIIISNSILGKISKIFIIMIFHLKRINIIDKLYKKIYKLIHR